MLRTKVLIKDLTSPPKVEIIDDKHQKFDGIVFKKAPDGHFINGCMSLHRYAYFYYYGEISPNYEFHHRNLLKSDNDISNLQILTKYEHRKLHNQLYKKQILANPEDLPKCTVCGKIFKPQKYRQIYCSHSCASKENWDKKKAVAPMKYKCIVCGI